MAVALRTLASNGGGTLVASGHQGEAERLAVLAPQHHVLVSQLLKRPGTTWSDLFHSWRRQSDWLSHRIGSTLGERAVTCGNCVLTSAPVWFPPSDSGGVGGGFKRVAQRTRHSSQRDVSSGGALMADIRNGRVGPSSIGTRRRLGRAPTVQSYGYREETVVVMPDALGNELCFGGPPSAEDAVGRRGRQVNSGFLPQAAAGAFPAESRRENAWVGREYSDVCSSRET